jgi:two-component system NtrC family sensor kinase
MERRGFPRRSFLVLIEAAMAPKPSLRTELVFNLAFLAAAALLLGVGTILLTNVVAPERAFPLVITIVALDVGIFIVFGHHIVTRLVLRPVERLMAAADDVVSGDLAARAPDAETRDFATLAERVNRMTDHLLDAQSQLVRSEKLAGIGRLAAGIAHEVGNPLGALGTYVEVLRRRGGEQEVIEGMARELQRIDAIVRSLLAYARPQEEELQAVEPAAIARSAFALLQAQGALKSVSAKLDVADSLPTIRGRAHLLEQTLVNLILNAVDAAPGGLVIVGARRWNYEPGKAAARRKSDAERAAFPRAPARRAARIEFSAGAPGTLLFVADSGPGVAAEDRERVFDPFYTTKPPGRGTGLGLALVARAVHDMEGVAWVDRAREGGAAFKLFFPEMAVSKATGER